MEETSCPTVAQALKDAQDRFLKQKPSLEEDNIRTPNPPEAIKFIKCKADGVYTDTSVAEHLSLRNLIDILPQTFNVIKDDHYSFIEFCAEKNCELSSRIIEIYLDKTKSIITASGYHIVILPFTGECAAMYLMHLLEYEHFLKSVKRVDEYKFDYDFNIYTKKINKICNDIIRHNGSFLTNDSNATIEHKCKQPQQKSETPENESEAKNFEKLKERYDNWSNMPEKEDAYILRMKKERLLLQEKLNNLYKFRNSVRFGALANALKRLMLLQADAMETYEEMLDRRIAATHRVKDEHEPNAITIDSPCAMTQIRRGECVRRTDWPSDILFVCRQRQNYAEIEAKNISSLKNLPDTAKELFSQDRPRSRNYDYQLIMVKSGKQNKGTLEVSSWSPSAEDVLKQSRWEILPW